MMKRLMASALLGTLAFGCAEGADGSEGEDLATGEVEQELYQFSDGSSTFWPTHTIPVCFSQATWDNASWAARRTTARDAIENSFGRVTDLKFTGWDRCPNNANGRIRINFTSGPSGQTDGGYQGTGAPTVSNVGVDGPFVTVLLHEFAHALGFDHELDRSDAPSNSCLVTAGSIAGTTYTPYDNDSITNSTYGSCVLRTDLSPWDVVGLQRVYGRKPIGAIVGPNNKCLDIDNPGAGQPSGATRLQAWDCLDNANQRWVVENGYRVHGGNFTYGYMDVQWAASANGTPLWNWNSQPGPAQTWKLDGVQIVGLGDLCLEVTNNNWFVGAPLRLGVCNTGSLAQRFYVDPVTAGGAPSRIRGRANQRDYCVAMTANQSAATLQDCGTAGSQQLLFHNRHIVTQTSQCLDVQWGNAVAGTTVWGYACNWANDADAQQWKIRGPITGLAGKCADFDTTGGVRNGSSARLWSCLNSANQRFEYYF